MTNTHTEINYIILLFVLFVLPRSLTRFRIPTAVSALILGAISKLFFGLFHNDPTIELLATFGIVSLFLFAGLEIELSEVKSESRIIGQHLLIFVISLGIIAVVIWRIPQLGLREAALIALALMTPSTGFILSSIKAQGLSEREQFWIRVKAIAAELVALVALFLILQSESFHLLTISVITLSVMIAILPPVFRFFARTVAPVAPNSEFAFLLMVAVICAFITRQLGVYYLLGAFIVGIAAQRLRSQLPALTSERMLHAVEVFASFFVPFYFFNAGLHLEKEELGWKSLGIGLAGLVFLTPLRVYLITTLRNKTLTESFQETMKIGTWMIPTLVFSLVIAGILKEKYSIPGYIYGGIVFYAIFNTLLPSLIFKSPAPEYEKQIRAHPIRRKGRNINSQ